MRTPGKTARRASRATKVDHVGMDLYEADVRAVRTLTPHLRRITFVGESLRRFRDDGPDQRFKLLLPQEGQHRPVLPESEGWYDAWRAMPADIRPVLRTYTIRSARPEAGEVDVDFVLHEPSGPASRWAAAARPGDRVALYAAWAEYEVPEPGARQLVVGDHTALPAVAAIVERMDEATRGDVVLEVPGPDDRLPLEVPPGVRLVWVDAVPGSPGASLTAVVTGLAEDVRPGYAWVAADRDTVAVLRRHLVEERGLSTDQIMFMGYWRTDGAIDE
jgi:NADPH-dependent ferric siderophore reductase